MARPTAPCGLAPLHHRGFRLLAGGHLAVPFAAAPLTIAILAGLSQRAWRDFGLSERGGAAFVARRADDSQPGTVPAVTDTLGRAS
jgi:hypothetical protein